MKRKKQSQRHSWQAHIDQFNKAGGSKAAYCRKHDLNYHQFMYWHGQLSVSCDALVPVKVKAKSHPTDGLCTVELVSGHRLSIHDPSVLPMLKQLIQALS